VSRLTRVVVSMAAVFVVAVAPASAAATWTPAATVAPGPNGTAAVIDEPVVASDGHGGSVAAWIDRTGAGSVQVSTRAGAGTWTAATALSSGAAMYSDLTLHVSADGHAIAGWIARPSAEQRYLEVATRAPGAPWSAPERVEPAPTSGMFGWTMSAASAITADGAALLVWDRSLVDGGGSVTGSSDGTSTRPASGGAWQTAADSGERRSELSLGLDDSGNATVLYVDGSGTQIRTASRPAGSGWQPSTTLDTRASTDPTVPAVDAPQLAVSPTGAIVASWLATDDSEHFVTARRSASGAWGAPVDLASGPLDSTTFDGTIGIDASGAATALWHTFTAVGNQFTSTMRSSTAPAGGTWSPAQDRGPALHFDGDDPKVILDILAGKDIIVPTYASPRLAVGAGGETIGTWLSTKTLTAAVRRAGGAWEPAASLATVVAADASTGAPAPAVTVDAYGAGAVVWGDDTGVHARTIALSDRVAPPVGGGDVPTGGGDAPTSGSGGSETGNPSGGAGDTPAPSPGTPSPSVTLSTPAPAPTPAAPKRKRAVVAVYLVPAHGTKCPARAVATWSGVRTALAVTRVRQRSGKIRCRATGSVAVTGAAAGKPTIKIVVTAKGVARRTFSLAVVASP
jgi:hypothetical protein